jgi:carbonic anhydrase
MVNTNHITYDSLLEGNKQFVLDSLNLDPNYFKELSDGQAPPILWIGCADSRVPANQITGTKPGEIFVHRNISNMVIHTDMSMLSVLDYAVNILKVKHVIVCGHYGCGGVLSAMSNKQYGLIDNWLRHIKDVYRIYQHELDAIEDINERGNRLVELNVKENVYNLCKTFIIQNAWNLNQDLQVHGWAYDLGTGYIQDLDVTFNENKKLDGVFQFDL